MNAPTSPPAHRLPVLTEVVSLDADGSAAVRAEGAAVGQPADVPVLLDVAEWPGDADHVAEPAPAEATSADALRAAFSTPSAAAVTSMSASASTFRSFAPTDAVAQAIAESAHEAAVVAATALEEARGLPGSDLPQPPQWLRRHPMQPEAPPVLPLPAVAPPSPLPPDFTGSWWTRDDGHVPAEVTARDKSAPARLVSPPPALSPVDEVALVRRVMRGLDGQIDLMFDHRMSELIAPALARAADALIADLRERLAVTVRDMVVRAVAVELSRQQREGDAD